MSGGTQVDGRLKWESLTSATGGRGSYHMEYSHYDEVPHQLQAKVIASARTDSGAGQTHVEA